MLWRNCCTPQPVPRTTFAKVSRWKSPWPRSTARRYANAVQAQLQATRVVGPPHFRTRREGERAISACMIRSLILLTLGVSFLSTDHQGHRSSRLQPVRRTTASGVRRSGRSRVVRDSKATRRAGGAGSNSRITRSLSRSARRRVGSFSSPTAVAEASESHDVRP